jgi:2-C-methyl-D-erythritol 2,4-cyclodiphosphate synthase
MKASASLNQSRVGHGYDVHQLVEGRTLVLGGAQIPFDRGLLGHSDADVLVHAACDALLGAAGLGDLGTHFPDTDNAFENIYSIELLQRSIGLVAAHGYQLVNMDATVLAQAPKLAPYREQMQRIMAQAMGVRPDQVNIKATTTEGLGFIGRGEGIAAMCVVLINGPI